jgi:hypothetical protein
MRSPFQTLKAKDWFILVVAIGILFFSTLSTIRAMQLLWEEESRIIGGVMVGISLGLFFIGVLMLYQMRSEIRIEALFEDVDRIQKDLKKEK